MALEGSLREFNLADILQLLYFQKKTGVLLMQGRFDKVRLLFFEGSIVGAESRKRDVENRLGRVLVKRGVITPDNIQAVMDKQKEEGGRFGSILVKMGFATKEQIQEVITFQITETLVQLFSWKEGRYEFQPQSIPIDRETGVVLNTEHFLMEGARLVDEWSEIKDRIDVDTVFLPEQAGVEPTPEEQKILAHVDGENDVAAIADATGIDSFTVSMTLLSLLEKGVVSRKKTEAEMPTARVKAAFRPIPGLKAVMAVILVLAFVFSILLYAGSAGNYRRFRAWIEVDMLRQEVQSEMYLKGSYPDSLSRTDPWGNPYILKLTRDSFFVFSAGPDGRQGTPDDAY